MVLSEREATASTDVRVRESRWSRTTAISGIVFAVLFVAGMMTTGGTPEYDAVDQEWLDWYDDSGNRGLQLVSAYLFAIATMALVVFISGLGRRLARGGAGGEGWSQVAYGAGLLSAVSLCIGGVTANAMSAAIEIGDIPIPSADVLRGVEQLAFGVVLVAGGLFAALMVGASSLAARATGTLPPWLVTTGFVLAVLLLFSVAFIPMIALPLWVLLASIHVLRQPAMVLETSTT